MNPFICLAEGAYIRLDTFYEVVHNSLLVVTGMQANRAEFAYFGQCPIQ
jgi:hypothetical protein